MSGEDEVSAYASAASQKHLDELDNAFVNQVLSLAPPGAQLTGLLLDVGCGPGNIVLKIARRCPLLSIVGLDYSLNMVRAARQSAVVAGLEGRVWLHQESASQIPFPSSAFDIVLSNSVLHHLEEPIGAFEEMLRVTKPEGAILARDLCRPSRLAYPWYVHWYGRHYSGIMKRLYKDSVRAAYTPDELADLLERSGLSEARIFVEKRSHVGFVYRGLHQ